MTDGFNQGRDSSSDAIPLILAEKPQRKWLPDVGSCLIFSRKPNDYFRSRCSQVKGETTSNDCFSLDWNLSYSILNKCCLAQHKGLWTKKSGWQFLLNWTYQLSYAAHAKVRAISGGSHKRKWQLTQSHPLAFFNRHLRLLAWLPLDISRPLWKQLGMILQSWRNEMIKRLLRADFWLPRVLTWPDLTIQSQPLWDY